MGISGSPIQVPLPKENTMKNRIQWKTEFAEAVEQARKENKAVLVDFYNPG